MFWNKKKDNDVKIITRVTRTADEAKTQRLVEEKVNEIACKCPECGFTDSKNTNMFGYITEGTNTKGKFSTCIKCGTKWETEYNLYL